MRKEFVIVRKLTTGQVLCTVTDPEAFNYLKDESNRESIEKALNYQGLKLVQSDDLDYCYAAYVDLGYAPDAKAVTNNLQRTFNTTEPFLSFMKLIMEASGDDQYPSIGHVFFFGSVLSAIENNEVLANELVKLTSKPFFKRASSRTNYSEKLRSVIDLVAAEGIVVSDDSGSHYTFTGKLALHIALIERVLEIQAPELLDEPENDQVLLELL